MPVLLLNPIIHHREGQTEIGDPIKTARFHNKQRNAAP